MHMDMRTPNRQFEVRQVTVYGLKGSQFHEIQFDLEGVRELKGKTSLKMEAYLRGTYS